MIPQVDIWWRVVGDAARMAAALRMLRNSLTESLLKLPVLVLEAAACDSDAAAADTAEEDNAGGDNETIALR